MSPPPTHDGAQSCAGLVSVATAGVSSWAQQPVISKNRHFTAFLPIFWFFHSFHPLFCDVFRASEGAVHMSSLG